ncbi:cytochrome c oxidase subunit 4 [Catellatospora vulcania]|uniref:cytochrome c oxidase subunit 4 n=1 Tax=Catellatospora vulcania TaxID=1460450 RepID=UPI0012D44568|nr:cytochrome c oxidase subunit 4 [Catellatospora vulcania]
MKTEYRLFIGVAGFLIVAAIVYGWWTNLSLGGIEWIGTVALVLSFLLCSMCGGYFWFVSRRIDPRPEDRLDAEIADGAGELGFFSPGSYWPFGIALSALIASLGLVFWMWWLIALGILCVLLSTSAMLFEYYTGTRRTAEH